MDNPLIIILGISAVAAAAVLAFVFLHKGKKTAGQSAAQLSVVQNTPIKMNNQTGLIDIPITRLVATTVNENSLSEIKDHTVIARINQMFPAVAQTATRSVAHNAQSALKGMELFKAVIPSGATLVQSKQMEGAVRGFYRGAKNIQGQANWMKIDSSQIANSTAVANGVANVMNVGSMIVGQYYMSEINDKLEEMSRTLDQISDFQKREFKSRIMSLIASVEKYTDFRVDIIENDEVRLRTLDSLEELEREATKLLGQVNIEITDIVKKNPAPTYDEYEAETRDFTTLLEYQNVLVVVLSKISELVYLLNKGGISSEMSHSLFNKYMEQSVSARGVLVQWHTQQAARLKVDINNDRRTKMGIADLPGFVFESFKYKSLSEGLADKIDTQSGGTAFTLSKPKEVYEDDVEIVIRDGKYYYLHGGEIKNTAVKQNSGINNEERESI